MANGKDVSPASAPSEMENQITSYSSSSRFIPSILGVIIITILILFVSFWLCFCFRRKICACFTSYRKKRGKLEAKKMNLRRFNLEELQKATNNFSKDCLIGRGAFGDVYRGNFASEGILAIKKPRSDSYTSIEDFRNEVRLLSKVKHHNLVGLVGFCEDKGPKAAKILVYEYVTNGSLLDYIIGRGGKSLTWRERVDIAIGAARGIAHLHEESIIHRDIKPSNILIGEGFEAKVSDFGLVRSGPEDDKSYVSSQVKGTPGYLDPAYCSSFHLTPFTDVYSFGVILLQLVTGGPAVYSTKVTNATSHIIDWTRSSIENDNIGDILDTDLLVQGSCNMEVMLKMGQLGLKCVEKVPKERPTMPQVCQELEEALESIDGPMTKHRPIDDSTTLIVKTSQPTLGPRMHSIDHDYSYSIVSVDGIGLERFHVDVDNFSFQSANLRCLETSISME